jgi:hypothetical protein
MQKRHIQLIDKINDVMKNTDIINDTILNNIKLSAYQYTKLKDLLSLLEDIETQYKRTSRLIG